MSQPLQCPFCSEGDFRIAPPERLFSFGFQQVGICRPCIDDALEGWKRWRWQQGTCIRCSKPGLLYWSAPGQLTGIGGAGCCVSCLNAGQNWLRAEQQEATP